MSRLIDVYQQYGQQEQGQPSAQINSRQTADQYDGFTHHRREIKAIFRKLGRLWISSEEPWSPLFGSYDFKIIETEMTIGLIFMKKQLDNTGLNAVVLCSKSVMISACSFISSEDLELWLAEGWANGSIPAWAG